MKNYAKRILVLSAALLLVLSLCGCTGIVDPPVVEEAKVVVQESEYFVENDLAITEFDFIHIQTNRGGEAQHIGYYYVEAENAEFALTETALIVWDFDYDTQQWNLNTIEHQDQVFDYFS